ncbi:uncharacterized protein LOC131018209 [Salvia miltiorrhiza]|uniref:uncharacterized protein LOC131018209 n=1 Tax=Salvia miltiorrhiza TaxID=226208 RepID=UPI0025AD8CCB|nr:uncharacterized protein LOC131018209 [Salvia miltiorrhiza]
MMLWQIWRDRNGVVWRDQFPVPARSVEAAAAAWSDWKLARKLVVPSCSPAAPVARCSGWHSLPAGHIKCNVDAAFFDEENKTGLGLVIRDYEGAFVVGKSVQLMGRRSVEEGELLGIKEALSWIKELGYSKGVVETDCKRAADFISSRERNLSEVGIIADYCRSELLSLPDVAIAHVKRDQNAVAHGLAKLARDLFSHHVWSEPPISVVGHLHIPCSCDQ